MIRNMNLGFPEMIFLFLLALIIFGPKKMPEIGRQIGKALNEFKRASNEFKAQIESEINQLELENQQILPPSQPPVGSVPTSSSAAPALQGETVTASSPSQTEQHAEGAQPTPVKPEQAALPESSVVEGSNA